MSSASQSSALPSNPGASFGIGDRIGVTAPGNGYVEFFVDRFETVDLKPTKRADDAAYALRADGYRRKVADCRCVWRRSGWL